MPTFTQALLLGTDRIGAAPTVPHAALAEAWAALDWSEAKETALLDAAALLGTAGAAAGEATSPGTRSEPASAETQPLVPGAAVDILRRLFAEEWRALLPEWLELCAQRGARVPPFFLPALLQGATPAERPLLRPVAGERGRWLARQNPAWSWLHAGDEATPLDPAGWETGTPDERLGWLRRTRATDPAAARARLEQGWTEENADFRAPALGCLRVGLGPDDEAFLMRLVKERRKEVRLVAQALLVSLPKSAFAARQMARAEALLTYSRGLLGRKLEIALPAAFDPGWAADGIEEKPPAGVGEKAHWTQQILALVPLAHWGRKFDLEPVKLVELAGKSADWAELLLGAWYRSADLHRDAAASAALIGPLLARQKPPVPGLTAQAAAIALLAHCTEAQRWVLVQQENDLFWPALPLLGGSPQPAVARALFNRIAPSLRDALNPGGSPAAVLAARRMPPGLHAEAVTRLARDNGLTKPAEAFLQALELRATLHQSFAQPLRP